jgi:RNA polymerase sigma-70 factor, ECF subfamily
MECEIALSPVNPVSVRQHTAFARLWDKERERVWRLIVALSGSRDEADDLTQEVGIRALEGFGRFRGLSSPSTWLHRIAVNVTLRHRERRRESFSLDLETEIHTKEAGPERLALSADTLSRTQNAIERLPDDLRTPLVLLAWEELSYKEIAALLEIPIGTVMSRLHTARQRLRKEIGDVL